MQNCAERCVRELDGIELYDAPFVQDDEWLCRTVRPRDYNTRTELKPSFIQNTSLQKGELSVWRVPAPEAMNALKQKIEGDGRVADNILAVQAGTLRAIRIGGGRGLCVVNDTRTDEVGGNDLQHAALAPCLRIAADEAGMSDLKHQLRLVFRNGVALHPHPQAA